MLETITSTLLFIGWYLSGMLLWPLRYLWCWYWGRKMRGWALGFVFLIQAAAIPTFLFLDKFYSHFWDVGYGWAIIWIEFNILSTLVGIIAWIRDAHYEQLD